MLSTSTSESPARSRRLVNGPFWYGLLLLFVWLSTGSAVTAQTLSWQKQFNGPHSLDDEGAKVKSDTSGNVYVTGTSEGDIVTIKYNAAGVQQWVARYDNIFTNDESATLHTRDVSTDLLVDASGNAYVTGTSYYPDNCDKVSVVTLKYNPAGVQQWKLENTATAFCGDAGQMQGPHLATDGVGNLYLAVSYNAGSNPDNRIVLQKLTPAGSEVWKSSYEGTLSNVVSASGLDVDAAGNAYIAGSDTTALLLKYNQAGILQWQRRPEGISGIRVRSDAAGNAYVIGSNGDIVTLKYDAAGVQRWRVSYNSGEYLDDFGGGYIDINDEADNLLVDASGNAYVTGRSYSFGNCVFIQAVALKYSSQGVPQWTTNIAGVGCDGSQMGAPQVAMDDAKNPYFAVSHHSESESNFHLTIEKLTSAGKVLWKTSYDVDKPLQANALHVDAPGNAYLTGSLINYSDDFTEYEIDVLTLKYAASAVPACQATGTILREYWANVPGSSLSSIPVDSPPTSSSQLTSLRTAANVADSYAQRIRGFLCAPASGQYTFFIQGDDKAELWLSSDTDPANKQRIASASLAWSWTGNASQQSAPLTLVAGQSYYLEVLHKEGNGGDQVRVGWRTPSMAANAEPVIIPGAVLSPFQYRVDPPTALSITGVFATKLRLSWQDAGNLETGYAVERATNQAGPYAKVATVGANTLSYEDWSLVPNTTYFYRVNAIAAPGASAYSNVVSSATSTPTILREYWANVPGSSLSSIPVDSPPTSSSQLTSLRTAANVADSYAQRIRGYLLPPTSGQYTFFIQGDDKAELWLSSDTDPANKQRIASASLAWSWTGNASQQSAPLTLVAGQSYYLEVLHKEGNGGDQVRVGWRTPSMAANAQPVIIPGAVLSPFDGVPATPTNLTVTGTFTGTENSVVYLDWKSTGKHVEYFVLERALSASGPFLVVNPYILNDEFFSVADISVGADSTYFYRLYAANQDGASGYSNVVSATTPPPSGSESALAASGTRQAVARNSSEVLANGLTASPNPFSGQATITFTTAMTEPARLEVYDLQGRLAWQLFGGLSQAGELHQIGFDGSRLTQGLYLIRLATGHQVRQLKVLLAK